MSITTTTSLYSSQTIVTVGRTDDQLVVNLHDPVNDGQKTLGYSFDDLKTDILSIKFAKKDLRKKYSKVKTAMKKLQKEMKREGVQSGAYTSFSTTKVWLHGHSAKEYTFKRASSEAQFLDKSSNLRAIEYMILNKLSFVVKEEATRDLRERI